MTRTNALVTLAIGILLASTAAPADVITTMTGQGADTKVGYSQSGTNPVTEVDTNYGAEGTLHDIKSLEDFHGYNVYRKVFLRFDISGILGAGESFETAQLNMRAGTIAGYGYYPIYGLTDGTDGDLDPATSTGWKEDTITWNNAPAMPGTGESKFGMGSDAPATGAWFQVSASDTWYSSGYNDGLVDFLNADTNGLVTLVFFMSTEKNNNNDFLTKEYVPGGGEAGDFAPQLEYTVVPEPATMGLLGVGGLGMLLRRRSHKRN